MGKARKKTEKVYAYFLSKILIVGEIYSNIILAITCPVLPHYYEASYEHPTS